MGTQKQMFVPVEGDMETQSEKREKLLQSLSPHIPQAVAIQHWMKDKEEQLPENVHLSHKTVSQEDNKFIDLRKLVHCDMELYDNLQWEEKCEKLKESVGTIMRDDIHEIEQLTVQQNDSEYWHKAHFGRITASKCHEVMTRMKTLDKDETQTSENIVKRFLSPKNICTKAMETGGKWEKTAFHKYKICMKGKHCGLKVTSCGMFVSVNGLFGASPDGLVSCTCHGHGVLEIKCATKYWKEDPKSKVVTSNLPYISKDGHNLNKAHKYYSQVQFQMGITGRKWCDFVVFTVKCLEDEIDPLIIHVEFDKECFESLTKAAEKFWFNHLLKAMIVKEKVDEQTNGTVEMDISEATKANNTKEVIGDHCYASFLDSNTRSGNNCPVCHTLCRSEQDISGYSERSIGCDGCNAWFHFGCIGMNTKMLNDIGESSWFCAVCSKEMI